jgi:hypothetical protein
MVGLINCPVPYWGVDHVSSIVDISSSPAVAPWSVGGEYDRPICRRLVEEAGVPREAFGQRKKATTLSERRHRRPVTAEARASYDEFMQARGIRVGSHGFELLRNAIDEDLLGRIRRLPGCRWLRTAAHAPHHQLAFQWAVHTLKRAYEHDPEIKTARDVGGR